MSYHQGQSPDSRKHQPKSNGRSSDNSGRLGSSNTQTNQGPSDRRRGSRTETDGSGGYFSRGVAGIVSMIGGLASETETCERRGDRHDPPPHAPATLNGDAQSQLDELNSHLATMKLENDRVKSDLALTNRKVEDLQAENAHLKRSSDRERMEEQMRLFERQYTAAMQDLEQENQRLRHKETSLKDQLASRQSPITLDPFYNQVDQISEAQIIRDGNPSLNGINDAIDNFVTELLEEAGSIGHPNPTSPPSQELHFNSSLLDLLQSQNMTEEKAGYILDAALHDFLVSGLVSAFFARPVTPCSNSEHLLRNIDKLYHEIALQENWSVSQRWRSVTITHIAGCCSQACCDNFQAYAESEILKFLAWAFVIPASPALDGLRARLNNELRTILWDAHQLTTIIKRDFLSARLIVTAAPVDRKAKKYLVLDDGRSTSVWPKMGAQQGDAVIGSYKLGLDSMMENGKIKHLVKPDVITNALIHMIDK